MTNVTLPTFSEPHLDTFVERLDGLLQYNLQKIDTLLAQQMRFDWENLISPLEEMEDALEQLWSPIQHLHNVVNSKELRVCYQACLPKLSAYESAIGHNQALYEAVKSLETKGMNSAQHKIRDDMLRGFQLSGIGLSPDDKQRFETIQTTLAKLSNQFENNVLDASQAYSLTIVDPERLKGIPEHALHQARLLAEEKQLPGWILNLELPCYIAVITFAEDRNLRETIYKAYVTRASDEGPFAGKFDNSPIMNEILALRHEKACLLGFKNYAELSLATKMAKTPQEVMHFLTDLSQRAHDQAATELKNLQAFAREELGLAELAPWDIAFVSEKKKQSLYTISEETLRPYFPLPKVMEGCFKIVKKLYGMTFQEILNVDVWHPDVRCYEVKDEAGELRGYIYADLFARQGKRNGAWMDSLRSRRKLTEGSIQYPIATLACNFAKPTANQPPMLSHDEVLTLFHELGHCLHHVLTQVDYVSASGIHGVEWDAVELPSQFFENWCWQEEALHYLTAHVDSGEPLPKDLLDKTIAAKNFHSALAMMRQLEFSIFDFRIHLDYSGEQADYIAHILAEVREHYTVVPIVSYNRFQHSFSHIFAGGYAAGYYSYKWAEVLSSDAFARFETEGIFNEQTGRDFLHNILEVGGSRSAAEAFVTFRGHMPTVDALLRHNGIG